MVRVLIYGLALSVAIGGTALAMDVLVESDAERLDTLADELVSGREGVDGVLRWSDVARQPVTVDAGARRAEYGEGEDGALADAVTGALLPLSGDVEVVQRAVRVDGDRGTVALRARTDAGLVDATVRLARNGQGWLVTDLRVRR